jgi:hypothetical protein
VHQSIATSEDLMPQGEHLSGFIFYFFCFFVTCLQRCGVGTAMEYAILVFGAKEGLSHGGRSLL